MDRRFYPRDFACLDEEDFADTVDPNVMRALGIRPGALAPAREDDHRDWDGEPGCIFQRIPMRRSA